MKKSIYLLFTLLALAFVCASCGGDDEPTPPTTENETTVTKYMASDADVLRYNYWVSHKNGVHTLLSVKKYNLVEFVLSQFSDGETQEGMINESGGFQIVSGKFNVIYRKTENSWLHGKEVYFTNVSKTKLYIQGIGELDAQ